MRARVVIATLVVLVSACAPPGPSASPEATPSVAPTVVPATVAPTPTPVVTAAPTPTSTETLPTLPPPVTPKPLASPTIHAPPPIDEPTPAPTEPPPPSTPTPTPVATSQPPADDAPALEGACLTFTNQATGEFDRSLLVDLSFEEGTQDVVQVGMTNVNGGDTAEGSAVLPGLWQVQLGVNGQRLPQGAGFVVATVEDSRGIHDLLPQLAEAIGNIPANFRPGQSTGNSCGGF